MPLIVVETLTDHLAGRSGGGQSGVPPQLVPSRFCVIACRSRAHDLVYVVNAYQTSPS